MPRLFSVFNTEQQTTRLLTKIADTMPNQDTSAAVEQLFDSLATKPGAAQCRKCGEPMISLDATFFAASGKTWNVALPACPHCDLKKDTATFVPDMDC